MAGSHKHCPVPTSRDEQIEELMQQLRPKMEEALRGMVERAVDVPEHTCGLPADRSGSDPSSRSVPARAPPDRGRPVS